MSQTSRQDRLNRLRQGGIAGSMSRSQSGSENARARRGAQREAEFVQRFDPAIFKLDSEGRVTLKIATKPRLMVVAPSFEQATNATAIAIPSSPYWGYAFANAGSYNDTYAIMAWWPVPDDCDKTRKITLEFSHFVDAAPAGDREYQFAYSATAYTGGTDWNPAAVASGSVTASITAAGTSAWEEVGRVEWDIIPADAFPQDVEAIAFTIEREDPGAADLGNDIYASQPHLTYGLRYHHTHE